MPVDSPDRHMSVLDRIANGHGLRQIPAAAVPEVGLNTSSESLPTVFGDGVGDLEGWAQASKVSRVMTGQAHLRKRDFAGARSSFKMARSIDRDAPLPRIGLLQVEILVGNYRTATVMLKQLAKRSPEVFSSTFDIRAWHGTPEDYDELLGDFKAQIRDTSKASEMVRVLMAYVSWTNGDRQRAVNQIRLASNESPHESAWLNMLRALESPTATEGSGTDNTTASTSGGLPPL